MPTKEQNIERLINEVLAIEADEAIEAGKLGFMARAMVQATLPHRQVDGNEHIRKNGAFTLTMLAPSATGLPYGAIPRLLLAWITTEALEKKSRQLVLGDSLSSFMRKLDVIPTGGEKGSIGRLKNQTKRLFTTSVSCVYEGDYQGKDFTGIQNVHIADSAILWWDTTKSPEQKSLWQSTVTLSERFYNEVTTSPVPVDMRALKAIRRSPMAIDLYCWLTYRMSYLKKDTQLPWEVLQAQFGSDYKRVTDFKRKLRTAMNLVFSVYRDVNVSEGKYGLILKPSKPHIRKRGVSFMLTKDND
jgi:Plasmid encoded RepA protein